VPARPRWRWRERAHAAMRSTIGGGAALSLRYFWCFCYFAAPGLYAYTSQGPGLQGFRMRTERCGRCVGCGIRRSCRRPISRPITFYNIIPNSLSYSKFPHQQINILFYCGGGSGYRQPCRTPVRSGSLYCYGARTAHIRYMGPFMGPALVASCAATPLTAQPDAPCA
jgi:hypothetical protein